MELLSRVQAHIDLQELISPGGEVTVLVSGGADSTCAWHVLRELGYRVSALHVDHGLRGRESEEDARFCGSSTQRPTRTSCARSSGARRCRQPSQS